MENKTCKECVHYLQHYALHGKKIFRVFCGHCTVPPVKTKKPFKPACERFEQGVPDEDAFVSKEYLSKELLRYMMDLELLPEIREIQK